MLSYMHCLNDLTPMLFQADQLGLSLLTIEQLQSEEMKKKMEQRMQYV